MRNEITNHPCTKSEDDYLNKDITIEEIEKAVQFTKSSKSSGPDKIVYEMFKNNPSQIRVLEILYNLILRDKTIPWELSWTTPIFKKGDKNDTNSYRCLVLRKFLLKY